MNYIEESNRYILRGLFYLLGWFLIAPIVFAGIGGALGGIGGMVIGILASVVAGVWGYKLYLDWSARNMMREDHHGKRDK